MYVKRLNRGRPDERVVIDAQPASRLRETRVGLDERFVDLFGCHWSFFRRRLNAENLASETRNTARFSFRVPRSEFRVVIVSAPTTQNEIQQIADDRTPVSRLLK
jgi:hypothetical protein